MASPMRSSRRSKRSQAYFESPPRLAGFFVRANAIRTRANGEGRPPSRPNVAAADARVANNTAPERRGYTKVGDSTTLPTKAAHKKGRLKKETALRKTYVKSEV
jgi:hypothetical protein